ncbi:MAG: HAD-IC family P-type ATPase, partial [Hymenobacter sp.]|nr:HAD-IC family P-type ATPase [Hymenobacter sp.]
MEYHLAPIADVAQELRTSPAGLDAATAGQRLTEHGPNQIADAQQKTVWQLLLRQFTDVMVVVLLAAALVSGLMGELKSTYVILAIVLLNAVVGFFQEYRAEKAMNALQKMAANEAQVLRGGQAGFVPAADLVPGDVALLEAGNVIPADVRFVEVHALKVDESSLTGESANVEKTLDALPAGEYPLGDRLNLGYKGTFVTSGRATAYVVATGMNTELGKIAKSIQTEETATPLQKRLATLGKRLAAAAVAVGALFFVVGWLRGEPLRELLLVSISLAIAAIPEALPALVTIGLALGANRLVKSQALVRKLSAVETLGSVTYICTDKTGTLTLNKMTVEEIDEAPAPPGVAGLGIGNGLLTAMALNHDATQGADGHWQGESTEVALVEYAAGQGKEYARPALEARFPRVAELAFDSVRKCMTTLHQTEHGVLSLTKGAVDVLIHQLDANQPAAIADLERRADAMAERGYRVLGYAGKLLPELPATVEPATVESGLTFLGFAGLIDPPRDEARQAVAECKAAGITPVMITGDHPATARAIAQRLGIVNSADAPVLTGADLAAMDEETLRARVRRVRIYARVDPAQKIRIVQAL